MKFSDLRYRDDDYSPIETDLCIVGTGPAGFSIANEFAGMDARVLLVESGGLWDEAETQSLYDVESTGDPRSLDQYLIRRRILGGSSYVWSGRCAPFDPIDFERRPWVPFSGWPITRKDVDPFLRRAASYLGLGPYEYDETLWERFKVAPPRPDLDKSTFSPMFWQFSRSPRNPKKPADFARDRLSLRADNIDVLLHANLTHVNTTSDGTRYRSAEVSTLGGRRLEINSKAIVLCCGGVENARLLLASNRAFERGLGNQNDLVGRFLMDHIDCPIGNYDQRLANPLRSRFGHYWIDDKEGRHVYEHGLAISQDIQAREELLNCHPLVLARDPVSDDPWNALKRLKAARRPYPRMLSDSRTLFARSPEIVKGLNRRYFKHRPQLDRYERNELHLMLEQAPNASSRISLSREKRDALGIPLSVLHWKVGEQEQKTATRASALVLRQLRQLGFADPERLVIPEDNPDWIALCAERAHPTGTTRMSDSPSDGVVDRNCQVHGVEGLFVAGSSVFPTAGAANPTMMIVAMALRLADHLKTRHLKNSIYPTFGAPLVSRLTRETTPANQIKIGLIGAGKRISEIYLPVLLRQPSGYEVVGVTGGSLQGARRIESQTGINTFSEAKALVEGTRPDLLIVAVADTAAEGTVSNLIDLGTPILCETPLAWSASGVRRLIEKAEEKGVPLGVAEQFPFLPLEQFRKELLKTGVFGEIYAALNNFHSYSYHGIAQLRRYLDGKPISVRSVENSTAKARWQSASISFSSGAAICHSYGISGAALSPFTPSVQILGTLGSMLNCEITLRYGEAEPACTAVRQATASGEVRSIAAILPQVGRISWDNPFLGCQFSDEQIGVATLLKGAFVEESRTFRPLYTARDFLIDIEVVQAMRYSERSRGRTISLPLNERVEKLRTIASEALNIFSKSRSTSSPPA